jgi:hypothetical protein
MLPTVAQRVEVAIQNGFESTVQGWVMSEVLELFDGKEREEARNYILERCNIKETS